MPLNAKKPVQRLEKDFSENELKLAELEGLLNERLGVFGELFGIVRQVAGETKAQVEESVISGELSGRGEPLGVLAKTNDLPAMDQLELLWFTLQQEMTAQGEVKTFTGEVVNLDAHSVRPRITRVGLFTALADGQFVRYAGDGRYADLVANRRRVSVMRRMICCLVMQANWLLLRLTRHVVPF